MKLLMRLIGRLTPLKGRNVPKGLSIFLKYKLLSHLSGYEKFTQEEAAYAVEHVKADWNLRALEKARDFRKYGNRSPEEIKKRLVEFEYSTEQEANML